MSVRARRSIHLSLTLLAAAATLAAGATLAGAAARAQGSRAATAVRALDIGLERLHVPATWQLSVAAKVCDTHGKCRPMCGPGYDKRVYVSTFSPMLACSLNFHRNSVWVVIRSGKGATTRRTSAFDGKTVILSIPSRGVTFFGFGKLGVRAVNELEPSAIARLLARHLPARTPPGWRRLTDGSVSVSVPPSWPVRQLKGNSVVNPGVCAGPYFFHPAAFVGTASVTPLCPDLSAATRADAMVGPVNGAWLAGPPSVGSPTRLNAYFALPGTATLSLRINGLSVTITYPRSPNGSNAALVAVTSGGRPHYLVLGLGLSPTIAEEIVGSLSG